MPWQIWKHTCPDTGQTTWRGQPERCARCGQLGRYDGWDYSIVERWANYSQFYGLKPLGGLHGRLVDEFFANAVTSCPGCSGRGLLDDPKEGTWRNCPACHGFGRLYTRPCDQILALQRRVLDAFPEAGRADWVPHGRTVEAAQAILPTMEARPEADSDLSPAPVDAGTMVSKCASAEADTASPDIAAEEHEEEEWPEDPWQGVTVTDVRAYLDNRLVEDVDARPIRGRVYKPTREVLMEDALVDVVLGGREPARSDLADKGLTVVLRRYADTEPDWVVFCSTTDSMVSGEWGVVGVRIGSRGYLYYQADEGDSRRVLGAWEPAGDDAAFREAVLRTWLREWQRCCLPPAFGQWASGAPDLLREAVGRVLNAEPDAWGSVSERLSEWSKRLDWSKPEGEVTPAEVAEASGAPLSAVEEVIGGVLRRDEPGGAKIAVGALGDEERRIVIALLVRILAGDPLRQ